MIKEILSVFKSNTLMDRAFERSYQMLDLTLAMYIQARDVLRRSDDNKIEVDIFSEDSAVNKYQREVRKDVFNHLVLTEGEQLGSGLVLVSIVIDLERIGDYTVNIVEIAMNHPQKLHGGRMEEDLARIEIAVEDNFRRTIDVFKHSDEEAGRALIKEFKWVSRLAEDNMLGLVKQSDPTISCESAVALTLYLRSLQRINAHLRNVTTSVVNPFHRIGYKPKKKFN